MRSEHERLLDILEAIERIEKYAEEGKAAFEVNELIQTWIVHHITIIGEACRTCLMIFRRAMQISHFDEISLRRLWSSVPAPM